MTTPRDLLVKDINNMIVEKISACDATDAKYILIFTHSGSQLITTNIKSSKRIKKEIKMAVTNITKLFKSLLH